MSPSAADSRTPGSGSKRAYERLLAAGTQLLAREGLDGVNTNTIARAAQVGVGTFYQHFGDKFALHRAIIQRGLQALQQRLAEAHGASAEQPLEDQVRSGVIALLGFAQQQPDLFRATFGFSAAATRLNVRGRTAGLGLSSRPLEVRLREQLKRGRLDPAIEPAIAARGFIEMQVRCVLHWLEDPAQEAPDALIETLTRLHPVVAGQR
ncbi:TetR/AcrR family transcriptional regulator [Myxococcota bacterium]|nr:TetR/AcrR family transcriptional regulator [Myxococcota bacterium]